MLLNIDKFYFVIVPFHEVKLLLINRIVLYIIKNKNHVVPKRNLQKYLFLRNKQFFEIDGKWVSLDNNLIPSSDSFLNKVGIEKPREISKTEKAKIFNHILLNFKLEKNVYRMGLSLALSDMDDSMMIFESIINNCTDITPLKWKILNKLNKEDN